MAPDAILAAMSMNHPPRTLSAVLICAHGDGGDAQRNAAIRAVAERVAKRIDLPVAWAVIKQPETFAAAHDALGAAAQGTVAVYPFFMAEGYFVRVKLPKLLAEAGFADTIRLGCFGLDPDLVDIVEHRLRSLASMMGGREPQDCRIAMIAHGSGSGETASRTAAEAVVATLASRGLGPIGLGFIEEAPFFDDVIHDLRPEIVLGFFVSDGTHALDDVKTLVDATPSVVHHITAIGTDFTAADLIARRIEACVSGEIA